MGISFWRDDAQPVSATHHCDKTVAMTTNLQVVKSGVQPLSTGNDRRLLVTCIRVKKALIYLRL